MYGGDEINAAVLDMGTCTTKGGYSGEDSPKCVFPSAVGVIYSAGNDSTVGQGAKAVGESADMDYESTTHSSKGTPKYYMGTNSLQFRREQMEIKYPLQQSMVEDMEGAEALFSHVFQERLLLDPAVTPLLLAEPSFNTQAIREQLTELFFEKFHSPALFLSKSAVLTSFASGKASSLVLESGGGSTSAVAVHDGYVLTKSIVKSSVGGEFLTGECAKILAQKKVEIRPRYLIKSRREIGLGEFEVELHDEAHAKATPSYRDFQIHNIVRDVKESLFRVHDVAFSEEVCSTIPSVPYELPDGTAVEIGAERFAAPEILFNPSLYTPEGESKEEYLSVPQMIFNSIQQTDPDIRRELFQSILLAGGNSLLPQFPERLLKELTDRSIPQHYKVKLISSTVPAERKFSVWLGGSILASLGTFHQLWMSKQEYEEYGRGLVGRKCP